jgi:phosphoglycolate phosphatase
MMRYKAVGFDLDGTLVNTHVDYSNLNSVNDFILRPLGFPVDEIWEDRDRTSRQPLYEWLEHNGRSSERAALDKLLDDRCLAIEKLGAEGSSIYNGIVDTLTWLKENGVKLGLVTRGGHEYAILLLTEYGLLEFFDVIHGRDDFGYQDAKPSPKAMYHLAEELGVELSDMLYVGDSPTDYISARDANVDYAGVMTGRGSVELWASMDPKIHIIPSAADVRSLM